MSYCLSCKAELVIKGRLYSSNKCQGEHAYDRYIAQWKAGKADGGRGIYTRNVSRHVQRCLFEKFNSTCSVCSWDKAHPISGRVPLEIDHIDGNAENNAESNLRLLCPNCHALTPNYKNQNRGLGRSWRRLKYIKSESNAALAQW